MNASILHDTLGERLEVYPDRETWLAGRDRTPYRIGGSAVAAILGASAWASPWDVYSEKRLDIRPEHDDGTLAAFARGIAAEPHILADYAATNSVELLPDLDCIVTHPDEPWLCGSPDGFAVDPDLGLIGVEAKSGSRLDGWIRGEGVAEVTPDDDGADVVPDSYLFQVLTYLEVTGLPAWDVHLVAMRPDLWDAALALAEHRPWSEVAQIIPTVTRRTVRVHRDERTQRALVAKVKAWRRRHLVDGEPPKLDNSRACRAHLRDRFPGDPEKEVVDAPPEGSEALVHEWVSLDQERRGYRDEIARVERRLKEIEPHLCEALGDTYGVHLPDGKLVHVRKAPGVRVDPKRLAAEFPDAYAACSKPRAGSDYFRFYPSK